MILPLTRRAALATLITAPFASGEEPPLESVRRRMPASTPAGVSAIIARTLTMSPGALNTDWFGTLLVKGLLEWSKKGISEAGDFAKKWFDFHLNSKTVSPYSGHRARTVNAGGILITTYSGHFGLSFPCWELVQQFGDERARRVCLDVAKIILHQTARNRYGMVAHSDDDNFVIPDTCYFVVTALMIAYALGKENGQAFRYQAVYQLRTHIDIFLDRQKGLARTILLKDGLGKTYWTRATGWLLWSITGLLRHLPPDDPEFGRFTADLRVLADGIARAQDSGGALHLFVDDPASPLETTGTAMCALGIHESVRRGWLPSSFSPAMERAWSYVKNRITPDGRITGAYTGWAVPAENRLVEMDKINMGWIPGFVLSTAAELATD